MNASDQTARIGTLAEQVQFLGLVVAGYDDLAREFLAKIDAGEARSIRTAARFRSLLAREVSVPPPFGEVAR